MGVYKRGKVWWMTFTVNGKTKRVSTGLKSKRKAEEVYAQTKTAVITGQYVPASAQPSVLECPSFEVAVTSYVERQISKGRNESSYCALTGPWSTVFAGRRIDSITSEEIEARLREWQAEGKWTNATRNNRLNQLSGLFSYAYSRRWIQNHPTARGRVEKLEEDNARQRWLRLSEVAKLAWIARRNGQRWLARIILFAPLTGMRLGEICELRRSSLEYDDDGHAWLVTRRTKNGDPLYWPLEGRVLRLVEQQAKRCRFPGDYLFPGPGVTLKDGERSRGRNARSSIRRHLPEIAEAAGLRWGKDRDGFTFHTFRHYPERRIIPSRGLRAPSRACLGP